MLNESPPCNARFSSFPAIDIVTQDHAEVPNIDTNIVTILEHLTVSIRVRAELRSCYMDSEGLGHTPLVLAVVTAVAADRMLPAHLVGRIVLDNRRNMAPVDRLDDLGEGALAIRADTFHKDLVVAEAVVAGMRVYYAAGAEGQNVAGHFAGNTARNLIRCGEVEADMKPAVDHMV